MKIGLISDLHEQLPSIDGINKLDLDELFIIGDSTNKPKLDIKSEKEWWKTQFNEWCRKLEIYPTVVPGNHDFYPFYFPSEWIVTIRQSCPRFFESESIHDDLSILYLPFTIMDQSWAFATTEDVLENLLNQEPFNTKHDVVMSHCPPYGILDSDSNDYHYGSKALLKYIETTKPKYVFCGHVHYSRGIKKYKGTTIVNCSYTDEKNNSIQKIFIWDTKEDSITEYELLLQKE